MAAFLGGAAQLHDSVVTMECVSQYPFVPYFPQVNVQIIEGRKKSLEYSEEFWQFCPRAESYIMSTVRWGRS